VAAAAAGGLRLYSRIILPNVFAVDVTPNSRSNKSLCI
jgi:hypothetical protein